MANTDRDDGAAASTSLPESRLGTKAHWDEVYAREVKNFNDFGDEGEVWFGEDSVDRMVRYIQRYLEQRQEEHEEPAASELSVLDLGTGNGHMLFALLEGDAETALSASRMKGVDYSAGSISLAKSIGMRKAAEEQDQSYQEVAFEVLDLLDAKAVDALRNSGSPAGWDLVCDKGTYDAIALSSQLINGALPVDLYLRAVKSLTKAGGIFLITSCNFTEQELTAKFANSKAGFEVKDFVPTAKFSFGGQTGSTTTTISFKRLS
ncbi:hypothetical protein K437DRAFT_147393 [Tilletiaria anomala UBC 951]|uniref:Protein-lysine N-methyltransferase EFM4 n=1 Tax=Tilletiaria anomala (strain ATCC 24038 / CBS 436.72 / UBC 951) TaxID=1037660 RepID=A0A066VPK2_TILAU|nr:uncharacterized protein K437DRAFT_147393 [Tilletiaria anomala UBC 951]KDN43682.1 hypothetical protein K437DRAFT_147393 [Tilletiaria anomala UBC 951]